MTRSLLARVAAVATVGLVALAAAPTAQAQRLNFGGSATFVRPVGDPSGLLIDFLEADPAVAGTPFGQVTARETIEAPFKPGIVAGTTGVIRDLTTQGGSFSDLPVADFLTIGGYVFSVTGTDVGNAIGPVTLIGTGQSTTAIFTVRGVVAGGAYSVANALYVGAFSAQFAGLTPDAVIAGLDAGTLEPVSFSAEFSVTSVVPEPSTYALMGAGLAGLAGVTVRRRRTATTA